MNFKNLYTFIITLFLFSCESRSENESSLIQISRAEYSEKLYGFWLGQSIANWTGLITEMDKIGNIGEIKTRTYELNGDNLLVTSSSVPGETVIHKYKRI